MKSLIFIHAMLFASASVFAQELPAIFSAVPRQILRSQVLASYPRNTWLENLVIGGDGAIYLTNYPEGKVLRLTRDGNKSEYASIGGKIAGIAVLHKDEFLVTGWDEQGKAAVFHIDRTGHSSKLMNIVGGLFPNGILHLSGNTFLIADSFAGCIWAYNAGNNTVTSWLKSELLERSSRQSQLPAANGLKVYKNELYVSNTEKQILIKVPLKAGLPGMPEVYADKVNIDDFTFDGEGNIYAATNVYNCVVKISPLKKVTIVAGQQEGMAGCTAIISSKDNKGKPILLVSTCGGMAVPPPAGVEEGKIIELFLY